MSGAQPMRPRREKPAKWVLEDKAEKEEQALDKAERKRTRDIAERDEPLASQHSTPQKTANVYTVRTSKGVADIEISLAELHQLRDTSSRSDAAEKLVTPPSVPDSRPFSK